MCRAERLKSWKAVTIVLNEATRHLQHSPPLTDADSLCCSEAWLRLGPVYSTTNHTILSPHNTVHSNSNGYRPHPPRGDYASPVSCVPNEGFVGIGDGHRDTDFLSTDGPQPTEHIAPSNDATSVEATAEVHNAPDPIEQGVTHTRPRQARHTPLGRQPRPRQN